MSPWHDDDPLDAEYPDGDDFCDDEPDDADESETLPCPECGADVYEDAECCPACGHYIHFSSRPLQNWSWGWIALGVLGIAATILALLFA